MTMNAFDRFPARLHWNAQQLADAVPLRLHELPAFRADAGAVAPAVLWNQWGWPGCVALVAGFQLLSLAIALLGWKPVKPQALIAGQRGKPA